MKKFLALALISSFALAAFAADDKKPETKKEKSSCGMACCAKNKVSSCKECPDCGKKKADAPKKG